MLQRSRFRIGDRLQTPDDKRSLNQEVFRIVAPRYDFITRVLSFGRDGSWKDDLVAALPARHAPCCLDLACGTGDITLRLATRYAHGDIVGLDFTDAMLQRARHRISAARVRFVNQDLNRLDFPAETFDIITGGYALRNAPDLEATLAEMHRVLKADGVCAVLDFSKPPAKRQRLEHGLLKVWTGFWGLLLHGNPAVYGYIAASLRLYPDREELRRILARNHFTVVLSRLYFFGIIELLVFRRLPTASSGRSKIS